jgi:hypothetical protein
METRNYRAYLLRLWRESDRDPWRATLEDPHTGQRLGFVGIDRLVAYLRRQASEADRQASMDSDSTVSHLNWLLSNAARAASVAEWAFDKGRADEAEQKELNENAARFEQKLVAETRRVRAEAPEALAAWAAGHVKSIERDLKVEKRESVREQLEQFLREWRAVAEGACDVVTLHSWDYYETGWLKPGGPPALDPDG